MQLTRNSDYSVRVLLFLGLHQDRRISMLELSQAHGISRDNAVKLVRKLASGGWAKTIRGRKGGVSLAVPPNQINISEVIRHTEPGPMLQGWQNGSRTNGIPVSAKRLSELLDKAFEEFYAVLQTQTLADLLTGQAAQLSTLAPVANSRNLGRAPGAAANGSLNSANRH